MEAVRIEMEYQNRSGAAGSGGRSKRRYSIPERKSSKAKTEKICRECKSRLDNGSWVCRKCGKCDWPGFVGSTLILFIPAALLLLWAMNTASGFKYLIYICLVFCFCASIWVYGIIISIREKREYFRVKNSET